VLKRFVAIFASIVIAASIFVVADSPTKGATPRVQPAPTAPPLFSVTVRNHGRDLQPSDDVQITISEHGKSMVTLGVPRLARGQAATITLGSPRSHLPPDASRAIVVPVQPTGPQHHPCDETKKKGHPAGSACPTTCGSDKPLCGSNCWTDGCPYSAATNESTVGPATSPQPFPTASLEVVPAPIPSGPVHHPCDTISGTATDRGKCPAYCSTQNPCHPAGDGYYCAYEDNSQCPKSASYLRDNRNRLSFWRGGWRDLTIQRMRAVQQGSSAREGGDIREG
jgi:hypothetical protein